MKMEPLNALISKKVENIVKDDNPHHVKAHLLYCIYNELNNLADIVYSFYENEMDAAEKEVE